MSTMLERMIQRTCGPLSSLEPVATPAFAVVPPGEPGWAGAAGPPRALADAAGLSRAPAGLGGPPGQVIVEEAGDATPRPEPDLDQLPGRRPAQRAGARPGRPRARAGGQEHIADPAGSSPEPLPDGLAGPVPAMSAQLTPAPARSAPARSAPVAPASVVPGPDRASGRRSTSRGQLTAAERDEVHREPGPDPLTGPGEQPHGVRERATGTMRAVPAAIPAARPAAAPAEASATVSVEASDAEPGPAAAWPRPVRAPAHWPASPPPSARPGGPAEPSPESGPEVTISIGHIEVRSASVTERPRSRPPFRPQVSLTDFLSQDRRP